MKNKGFTIIELVVVMGIVAVVGTMLVMIFSSTLRGSNKSQMISAIKQGGQAVLENMDKTFRSAENVVCPVVTPPLTTVPSTQIVIYSSDEGSSSTTQGVYTRYRFIVPTTTTNGLIQRDNPIKRIDENSGVLETDSVFLGRICVESDPMDSATVLTDTSSETGISVTGGTFIRSIQAGSKDSVRVQFTLGPGVKAPSVIVGEIDPVVFQTTVELR